MFRFTNQGQLKQWGYSVRMDDFRLLKFLFYSQHKEGKRWPGGKFLKYKDGLKRRRTCYTSLNSWEVLAKQRNVWRNTICNASTTFEQNRPDINAKRVIRKTRYKPAYCYTCNSGGMLHCHPCKRAFKTKFLISSHLRSQYTSRIDAPLTGESG